MRYLAIIMTVHNRREKTIECLRRVYAQLPISGWSIHLYMTDDGCTDGTAEEVHSQFSDVNIISGDGNLFWNGGMRVAWDAAAKAYDYDAFLWLNDDTMLYSDALSQILQSHVNEPDAIIIGTTRSALSDKLTYGGILDGHIVSPNGKLQLCKTFNGNVVLVPKSVYMQLGNLDSAYSHSIGDIDYGLMACKKNIKSLVAPHVIGECENNPLPPKWMRTDLPFGERLKNLFSPLAYTNPKEYYHFKQKHWGHAMAILAMCSITLHLICPGLWAKLKGRNI